MRVRGRYSDGKVGGTRPVDLALVGPLLDVRDEAGSELQRSDVGALEIVAPVGPGPWAVELGDGARIDFEDHAFGRELLAAAGKSDGLGVLERGWKWAVAAVVVAVAGTWLILEYGVPVAAKYVAAAIPPEFERSLQRESIDVVDRWIFEASEVPEDRQREIQYLFADIIATDEAYGSYELVFRSAPGIGPNAFAMPGGTVLLTDQLLSYAQNDAELIAVLAHEVGHLANRHSLRILLQDSATALFIAGVTGDMTNVTALSASIPTVLMQSRYSRQFEREADEFAFAYLQARSLDRNALRDLLERIEKAEGGGSAVPGWLATHPETGERVPEAR